ncbi:dehydrogenase E1 component-domain-containing protein [Gorgonomyces haynaldii]|nr:dehydrogenase E1 component-domain-containing protein [Gorgonomyces haynaldii]
MLRKSVRAFFSKTSADSATFKFGEATFETHNCPAPPSESTATKQELLDLYKVMVEIRRLETACDQAYKAKLIRGFCHLSTGQEAIAAGMEAAITKQDSIITAYRCHGFTLTRGQTAMSIIAELMGRKTGCSLGKGGSMHLFGNEFYGGNGIVGAQVPVGAGIAFAHKYRNNGAMCFSLYGDGAANQGQVFEAYNMAKLWGLPVTFVCENNMYGMGTSAARAAASTRYYSRGDYIPGVRVNGMDVLAVREACKYARDWNLSGNGPLVLEMVTYRYGGHSMSDPGTTYRTREEIQQMRSKNDAINGIKERIISSGLGTEEELKAIDKQIRADIDKAVAEATASGEPSMAELFTDVYVKGSEPPTIRGTTPDQIKTFAQ